MSETTKQQKGQRNDQQLEQQHLEECLGLIKRNITYYEEEAAMRKAETARLMKAMTCGDPELYNQIAGTVSGPNVVKRVKE